MRAARSRASISAVHWCEILKSLARPGAGAKSTNNANQANAIRMMHSLRRRPRVRQASGLSPRHVITWAVWRSVGDLVVALSRARSGDEGLAPVPCHWPARAPRAPKWHTAAVCAAAMSSRSSLLHALAGFIIPLHVLGLRAVGLGLRRVFGLRQHRSCNAYGESQSNSRQEDLHRYAP